MSYQPGSWPPWQQPLPLHSPIELEHRLTTVEQTVQHHGERHEEHDERLEQHAKKFALHEKVLLGLGTALNVVLQERYPVAAKALRELIRGAAP